MKPGVYYNTGFNTMGVGNPMPPKKACLTSSDLAKEKNAGSGDLFPVAGEAPSSYWCQEWKDKREEFLKNDDPNKAYSYNEERPTLVFSHEPMANEKDYKPLLGGKPALSDKLID